MLIFIASSCSQTELSSLVNHDDAEESKEVLSTLFIVQLFGVAVP